jgi:hypothetical protein
MDNTKGNYRCVPYETGGRYWALIEYRESETGPFKPYEAPHTHVQLKTSHSYDTPEEASIEGLTIVKHLAAGTSKMRAALYN